MLLWMWRRLQIADVAEQVDDLLAGGATLEDVASETDLQLATLDWHVQSEGGISDYEEFQTAAAAVTAEDFPALGTLSDNGIFALRLDGELPAELQPLESVRDAVAKSWTEKQIKQQLRDLADGIAPQVSLDAPLASFGLTENLQDDMNRNDSVDGTPPALVMTAFETELGKAAVLDAAEGVISSCPAPFMLRISKIPKCNRSKVSWAIASTRHWRAMSSKPLATPHAGRWMLTSIKQRCAPSTTTSWAVDNPNATHTVLRRICRQI